MPNYYNEKIIVMPFLAKCDGVFSRKEQISVLINVVDKTTLEFILNLNPQEQGIEDFQKVIRFIKENQTEIITQLKKKNLLYSRINLALMLPTFIGFVSVTLLMATGCLPILALGVALLTGFAMNTALAVFSSIIYDNVEKQHLYEKIGKKLTHSISDHDVFFSNKFFLASETVDNLCNLPKIFGITS